MVEVKVGGVPYAVWFRHNTKPDTETGWTAESENASKFTECVIFNEKKEPVAKGFAQTHEKDNYEKSIGRALSLTRAVSDLCVELPVEVEKQVFEAFREAYDEKHAIPLLTQKEAALNAAYWIRYAGAMKNA